MTARSNNASLIYVRETVLGTTPVDSPDWKVFPLAGTDGLNMENTTVASTRVRSDRGKSGTIKVGEVVTGALATEFQATQMDDLLESTLMGTFAAGVLKNESVKTSYAMERQLKDLTNKFLVYNGVRVNGMTLTLAVDQKADANFELVGLTSDNDNVATLVGAGTLSPVLETPIMSINSLENVTLDGQTGYCLESITLTTTNNMEAKRCAGSPNGAAVDQLEGEFGLTLDIVVATTDDSWALLAKKRTNTPVPLSFDMTDGTTTYNFNIPKVYINFPDPAGQGANTSVSLNITGEAAQDETAVATLIITKT